MIEAWEDKLIAQDEKTQIEFAKFRIGNMISTISDAVGMTYGCDDLLIVKRGESECEVWTMREFKPNTLVFVPESTEIKQRFYSANRSAIARGSDIGKDRKPLLIDGRMRNGVDGKSAFGLFWLVKRTDKKNDPECNMTLLYSTMLVKTTVTIGEFEYDHEIAANKTPQIPCLTNLKKIAKHTQLVAMEDGDLKKYNKQQQAELVKEKEKQDKAKPAANAKDKDQDEPAKKRAKAT